MPRRLRLLASLTAAALVPLATISGPAAATTGSACPDGDVPAAGFADTAGNAHAGSIDCAVWWGITGGTGADTFNPGGTLTRAQLASMLARLVEKADRAPSSVTSQGFADTSGNAHARNIDMVAQLGVVGGYSDGTFRPGQPVTRAQVASMLVRLESNVFDGTFPVGDAKFDDIDSDVHRDAILRLVGAGITQGVSATAFGPGVSVTRAQMATFVMRHVDRHVADDTLTPPERGQDSTPPPSEDETTPPSDGGGSTYAYPGPSSPRPDAPALTRTTNDGSEDIRREAAAPTSLCPDWVAGRIDANLMYGQVDVLADTVHRDATGLGGCVFRRADKPGGAPQVILRKFVRGAHTPPAGATHVTKNHGIDRAYSVTNGSTVQVGFKEDTASYVLICQADGGGWCDPWDGTGTLDALLMELHNRPSIHS